MNPYIGHPFQMYGVQEMRLVGGKADGMRMLSVKNARGLCFMISLDRGGDISQLSFKGDNYGYFAPCGYVAPQYYDNKGMGFLKSFTAGFFTTCGLTAVGSPCEDGGEELPLHGTVSNTPCENVCHWVEEEEIHIKLWVRDASLFSHQLLLEREYVCPIYENVIHMTDRITNIGSVETPLEVLYHCNMGYPLLSEKMLLSVPSEKVTARNAFAQSGLENCLVMEKPKAGCEEMCFYHKLSGDATVSVFNPEIQKGLEIRYHAQELPCFTEWKLMGEHEYVLGLEPGNCLPDGRKEMREKGMLEFLKPKEEKQYHICFVFTEQPFDKSCSK